MSTHLHTLPASVGTKESGLSVGGRLATAFQQIASKLQEALKLRRSLREIEALTDRELSDIGLAHDEIHRLRRGDVFTPLGWTGNDVSREKLPF